MAQPDDMRNMGLIRIGGNCAPSGETTVVVIGVPRSGTSMVAAVLRQFGIHLGDELDTSVFEDRAIAAAIDTGDIEGFRRIVMDANARHRVWGFKRPKAFTRIDDLVKELRHPRLIVTMRDCVAIAVRNSKSVHHDEVEGIRKAAQAAIAVLNAVENVPCPVLMVSYEKAMSNPKRFARQVAAFCGLTPAPETIQDVVGIMKNGPELYLQNARLIYDGAYAVQQNRVGGWIMSNAAIPEIEILAGGKPVLVFRPDLPAAAPAGTEMPKGMRVAGFDIGIDAPAADIVLQVRNTVFRLRREAAD